MSVLAESSCMYAKGGQQLIGGLDVTVQRNFFGRQIKSFEIDIPTPSVEKEKEGNKAEREPYRAVFIRAPAIMTAGKDVEILAKIDQLKRDDDDEPRDVIVAVKQVVPISSSLRDAAQSDSLSLPPSRSRVQLP
jgi:5'-phosphate synthase pdxT subunit